MLNHALETPDIEVCGLLAGNMSEATSLYRIPNIATDPSTTFSMEPQAQIAALRDMRQHKEHLWAIYHSHPSSEALPSEKDLQEAAYPGTAYFIVSLMDDEPEIGSFIFTGNSLDKFDLEIIHE